jgi:hypothetical protein
MPERPVPYDRIGRFPQMSKNARQLQGLQLSACSAPRKRAVKVVLVCVLDKNLNDITDLQ